MFFLSFKQIHSLKKKNSTVNYPKKVPPPPKKQLLIGFMRWSPPVLWCTATRWLSAHIPVFKLYSDNIINFDLLLLWGGIFTLCTILARHWVRSTQHILSNHISWCIIAYWKNLPVFSGTSCLNICRLHHQWERCWPVTCRTNAHGQWTACKKPDLFWSNWMW